ncbi:MAG: siphovirus Gp157 family protein [Rivularia sp. (in: cyanobacteria)]
MTITPIKNNSASEIANRSLKVISEEAASLQRILLSIADEGSGTLSEEEFNELIEEKLAEFFNLTMEQAKKFDGLYWAYKAIEAEKKALKESFKLINEMQASLLQSYDRSLDGIKNYLLFLYNKRLIDDKNIGNKSTITIYDSPPSVQEILTDIEELPEKFKRTKVEADKKAIVNAYKQGKDVSKYASIGVSKSIRFGTVPKYKNKNR